MASLTIFLAPPGPITGVLDVLRDLSSAGLLADFGWLLSEPALPGAQTMVLVSSGDASAVNVSQTVSSRPLDRVRVCVLVPLLGHHPVASQEAEQALVHNVALAAGHIPVDRLRAVVIRPDVRSESPAPARPGWHNIVLSPEDAAGPDRGVEVRSGLDHLQLSREVGPALAGLSGLWRNIEDGPLDGVAVPPGGSVRMARMFYRRLRTAEVEHALLGQLTDMTRGLPRPVLSGGPAVHIDNVALATSAKAQEIFSRFGGVLQGPRLAKPVQVVKPLGFAAALRAFFSYLWAALRGAPARWYAGMVGKVSSSSAKLVQRAIFGNADVAYAVVVNGRTPDGRPADWLSRSRATMALESALYAGNAIQGDHYDKPNLSDLWAAFVSGGLTLADGGPRLDYLPPVEVGPARGVLRNPSDVAPRPENVFADISGALAAEVGFRAVRANDELGMSDLARRLKAAAAQSHLTLDAGRTLDKLNHWADEQANSYANQVGRYLSHYQTQAAEEVATLLAELSEAAGDEEIAAADARRRRRIARRFRWLALLTLVPLVVAVVLTVSAVLPAVLGIVIAGALLLTFFLGAALSFYRLNRSFFADLHRRQMASNVAEINCANLRQALLDVRRLTDAYREYLLWSDVLGAVVAAPFGDRSAHHPVPDDVGDGLPQAARVASVPPEGAAVAAAAGVLARDAFPPGWLTDPWESALSDGWHRFGPPGDTRPSTAMYGDDPDADGSPLVSWTSQLVASGVPTAGADRIWAKLSASLPMRWPQQSAQLLAQVVDLSTPGRVVPSDWFMAGIDGPPKADWNQSVDDSALSSSGKVSGLARISTAGHWQRTVRRGLDTTAVLVQLTDGFPAYELDLGPAEAVPPRPPAPPVQQDRSRQYSERRHPDLPDAANRIPPAVDTPRFRPPQGPSF